MRVNPVALSVEQISLADFFARIVVNTDGSVNLVTMFTPPDESDGAQSEAAQNAQQTPDDQKPPIRISRVTLSKGTVDFSDRFIKPNFNAKFDDLGGRISGLASIQTTRADDLRYPFLTRGLQSVGSRDEWASQQLRHELRGGKIHDPRDDSLADQFLHGLSTSARGVKDHDLVPSRLQPILAFHRGGRGDPQSRHTGYRSVLVGFFDLGLHHAHDCAHRVVPS